MKNFIWITLLAFFTITYARGQNRIIYGNGSQKTEVRTLPAFSAIYLDLPADVRIKNGGMPKVALVADENLLKQIDLEVDRGKLYIKVKEGRWIESGDISLDISVPFLTSLETNGKQTGIGAIIVSDIDVEQFECDVVFGQITLIGRVERLKIHSSNRSYYSQRGTIDARNLVAQHVDAKIQGSNSAEIYVTKSLTIDLMHDATLTFKGNPGEIRSRGQSVQVSDHRFSTEPQPEKVGSQENSIKLIYVDLEIKNNSLKRANFIIRGPSQNGKGFSYGFPMMPFSQRTERVPVGTEILLDGPGMLRKKLVTIREEDQGTVKNLF